MYTINVQYRVLAWANNVYGAVVNNGISGYVYWEGVQWPNPNTNEKLIKVDNSTNTWEVSRRLWALANWSRYVRSGPLGLAARRFGGENGGVQECGRNDCRRSYQYWIVGVERQHQDLGRVGYADECCRVGV
jgi:hypothetical protein